MKYTFEIRWPEPFDRGWRRYPNSIFDTAEEASEMLSAFLVVGANNHLSLEGRIVLLGPLSHLSHNIRVLHSNLVDASNILLN